MSVAARDHCLAPERLEDPAGGGRYGRLLGDLPALRDEEQALHALGVAGGPCDGAGAEGDDARVAAGWPFFGQFIAHDITADRSPLVHRADAGRLANARTPRVNLEAVYGGGPVGSPYLYERADPARMLLGEGGTDVPRNSEGVALIGDPRNDVHLFVNQLHVAFLHAHNRLVERLREDGEAPGDVFGEARAALTWHYQWLVLHDFLPGLVGAELADAVLRDGPELFAPGDEPFIPLEFADAAFRYGHSQIRHAYRVNDAAEPVALFPDLLGFGPVPAAHVVDWTLLFDVPGHPPAQRAKRIDGRLPASLIALPEQITGEVDEEAYGSLAGRDLQRGLATALPSGEAVAAALGEEPLTADEVGLAGDGWTGETPMWLYVLREADVRGDGDRLGPVGGRIVAEVLVGIIDADPGSFRVQAPDWRPTLPAHEPGRFGLADLLCPPH